MESRTLYVERPAGHAGRAAIGRIFGLLLLAAVGVSGTAAATPVARAVVEQVQWPVWVESAGRRTPVAAGQALQADDLILTGDQARVLIRLADGSAVKLGEQAQMKLATLGERAPGVLGAGLDVAKGSFRFTTGLFRQLVRQREVEVRFPTLTIGVRGTDFWGRSADGSEMVLLLEGSIAVARQQLGQVREEREERRLTAPQNYLRVEPGGALEERTASAEEVAGWAQETEPRPGQPSGRSGGRFSATIVGAVTRARAESVAAGLQSMGYPVRVTAYAPATDSLSGAVRQRYAVTLPGLGSQPEARVMRQSLRALLPGLPQGAWRTSPPAVPR